MKNFPYDKYKYFVGKNKVIAVSTYAGRKVRGVAKCSPEDEFDVEKGKELAAIRCGMKIAKKRLNRASNKLTEAAKLKKEADAHLEEIESYYDDSVHAFWDAEDKLEEIKKRL